MLTAALLAFPLSLLPDPLGNILPFVGVLIFAYFGVSLFVMRQGDIMGLVGSISGRGGEGGASSSWTNLNRNILLDTSVIIDGRVGDIAKTGFLPGTLLIPRFVLNELQYIADSPDGLRRARGRRGMETIAELQKLPNVMTRVSDIDVEGMREVDDKLVVLARQMKCPILTNDYNLNRVAELQGVTILNINELSNAVKSVVLPGEALHINIIQEGKEHSQGVGYMDDGTMVVVENGKDVIGEYRDVIVTKILQTAAGRMIFARVEETNGKKKEVNKLTVERHKGSHMISHLRTIVTIVMGKNYACAFTTPSLAKKKTLSPSNRTWSNSTSAASRSTTTRMSATPCPRWCSTSSAATSSSAATRSNTS